MKRPKLFWSQEALSEQAAARFSHGMMVICWAVILVYAVALGMILLGRTMVLVPSAGSGGVLLNGAKNDGFWASIPQYQIYLYNQKGAVSRAARVAVAAMAVLHYLPLIFCLQRLTGLFRNIKRRQVFVKANANILLQSGLVLLVASIVIPPVNAFVIPAIFERISGEGMGVSAGSMGGIVYGFALLIAAYVFHYGIYLQDEVDHTL